MPQPERNDPCPCGSGKKYKRCCGANVLPLPDQTDRHRREAFALEDRLLRAMTRFASRKFGRKWHEGIAEYLELVEQPSEHEIGALLMPWSYYLMPIEGGRLVEWYLIDRSSDLRDEERFFLLAQIDSWPSIWEAVEVLPGEGVRLRDVLTQAVAFVNDHSASQSMQQNGLILTRVVRLEHVTIFGGHHPTMLLPFQAQPLIEAARRLHRVRTRPVPAKRLKSFEKAARLYQLWDDYARGLHDEPRVPALTNTDGEPLLLTTDHFLVRKGKEKEVVAALLTIEGAHAVEPGPDPKHFSITKPGNAMVRSQPNTVLATLELRGHELVVDTNSLARADRIREAVEKACGGVMRHRVRHHADPRALIEQGARRQDASRPRRGPDVSEGEIPLELQHAMLQDFKRRHYASWPDESLPALGGKTPREAMRSPTSRARLEALLKEMELHERRLPEAERYDFDEIRRTLGLT